MHQSKSHFQSRFSSKSRVPQQNQNKAFTIDYMYSIVGRRSDYEALGEETAQFHTRKVFTEALATLPTEEKIALGHQIEDFILECSFRGRQCSNM